MTNKYDVDAETNDGLQQLLDCSSELVGIAVSTSAIGLISGDPVTAVTLGLGGKVLEFGFGYIGKEILKRMIAPREKIRVGASFAYALAGIQKRLESGDKPREDDFFDKDISGRSKSEEILENTILKCQREPEEKKISYISNVFVNAIFDSDTSTDLSHKIIKSAEQLTYQQLCILSMVGKRGKSQVLAHPYDYEFSLELTKLLHDCFELGSNGYILGGLKMTFSGQMPRYETFNPENMHLENIGVVLFNLMNLYEIPDEEIEPIAKLLCWEKTIDPKCEKKVHWNPAGHAL